MQLYCPHHKKAVKIPVSYGQAKCGTCNNNIGWLPRNGTDPDWIDQIGRFSWSNLYSQYDNLSSCKKFDHSSKYLAVFAVPPKTDRACYYMLIDQVNKDMASNGYILLPTYMAIAYWKFYFQPAALIRCKEIYQELNNTATQNTLANLTTPYKGLVLSSPNLITQEIKRMDAYKLPGIKTLGTIPFRATLLHMFFPNDVPIFDIEVLRAVGIRDQDANHKYPYYDEYIKHIRRLIQKHLPLFKGQFTETPTRVVDMALWFIR